MWENILFKSVLVVVSNSIEQKQCQSYKYFREYAKIGLTNAGDTARLGHRQEPYGPCTGQHSALSGGASLERVRCGRRYIKQIKARSCEMESGEDNVIDAKLIKGDDFLQMVLTVYGTEAENLEAPDEEDILRDEADEEIARRLGEGESYRSIAKEMGVSTKKVWAINNILKKRQGNN